MSKTNTDHFDITDYDYYLPADRIAQAPVSPRDASRLLCLERATGRISHRPFRELDRILGPGDLLVRNDTRVVPARLVGSKATGGRVEALLLDYPGNQEAGATACRCLLKAAKQVKPGTVLTFEDTLAAEVTGFADGLYTMRLDTENLGAVLEAVGRVPLPPYIEKNRRTVDCDDQTCYQTVYAREKGAVAAPTAGLHFTGAVLEKLEQAGVKTTAITLHVGHGTFLPVRVTDIREHHMHAERFTVPETTAEAVNQARESGGRVVAVGTTVVRVLEYLADDSGRIASGAGECDLFIYPGHQFRAVDALLTNFHLPRSTLLMLVAAFAERKRILAAYQEAMAQGYRFYSYGDAMLIE